MRASTVTVANARRVDALYRRLAVMPIIAGPGSPDADQQQRARAHARRCGWIAPLGWDDIDHDRAPCPDSRIDATLDRFDLEVALERITQRRHVNLDGPHLDAVVHTLTRSGRSLREIAELLDVSPRTVSRHRATARIQPPNHKRTA